MQKRKGRKINVTRELHATWWWRWGRQSKQTNKCMAGYMVGWLTDSRWVKCSGGCWWCKLITHMNMDTMQAIMTFWYYFFRFVLLSAFFAFPCNARGWVCVWICTLLFGSGSSLRLCCRHRENGAKVLMEWKHFFSPSYGFYLLNMRQIGRQIDRQLRKTVI